jgi:hypothetical protein
LGVRRSADATTDVILVARSIGRRSLAEPLSGEGHAGLVFDLGGAGTPEHWIVQAGPDGGLLQGTLGRCSSAGWRETFALAGGAVWETGGALTLPVSVLLRISTPATDGAQLAAIVTALNERRLPYRYQDGPNSNTFVRMVLERIGTEVTVPPAIDGLALRGWGWEPPQV